MIPEVLVTADHIRIQINGTITLTCSVTNSNPNDFYMYTWTLLPSTTITGPTSSSESTNTLKVTPGKTDDYGTYQCSVTNDAGTGMADITIEQGCKGCLYLAHGLVLVSFPAHPTKVMWTGQYQESIELAREHATSHMPT